MQMAGDCTHHDRSKDLLVGSNIELMRLLLQVVAKTGSTWSGCLVVEDRKCWKMHTGRYSSGLGTGW
jgi:hypothetical protein